MTNFLIVTSLSFIPQIEKPVTEFVVKINDRGDMYTKALLSLVDNKGDLNLRNAKGVRYGDYLVFEQSNIHRDTDSDRVLDTDLPVYKLVDDYNKIEKLVKNYFKNVYKPKSTCNICDFCPFNSKCKAHSSFIIRDGEFVEMEEKVSIKYNFVKVGYEQYDIYTYRGKKYADIEGETFEVNSDYKGKYLELVR